MEGATVTLDAVATYVSISDSLIRVGCYRVAYSYSSNDIKEPSSSSGGNSCDLVDHQAGLEPKVVVLVSMTWKSSQL